MHQAALSKMQHEEPLTYVAAADLHRALATGAILVDVRSDEERADGCVRAAHSVHVPCPDGGLPANVSELLAGRGDLIFTCMYSHERGPRAAREWARLNPGVTVRVLRGGFQKLMTHLFTEAQLRQGKAHAQDPLLERVNPSQWVQHGKQGLVWKPDLGFALLSDGDAARCLQHRAGIPAPPLTIPTHSGAAQAPDSQEINGPLLFLDCDGVLNTTRCLTCDYAGAL